MRQTNLQNKIPVVLVPMKGTDVVTALILFKVGSRNENARNNGVSHFVEHLFFKGTEKRPTTLDISKELDSVGADFNAFTSKDYTGYYIKVPSRHTKLAIDILEDLLFHPIFDQEEINRERGVIVEEINMYEDNPMVTAEELSEQLMFGANHPLGYRIAGPKENILNISRQSIINYRDKFYHAGNMVIVLTGNLPAGTNKLLKDYFGKNQRKQLAVIKPKKFIPKQKQARILIQNKKTAQAHLALSFPGPAYQSKDLYKAQLLSTILGGTMSSRLFINVRERQGLCYYILSAISPYEDMGAFTIRAGFDTQRIDQAIQAIITEVRSVRDNLIDDDELSKAKEFINGKMSLRMEDSENVAAWWGKQSLFQKKQLNDVKGYIRQINQVTNKQLHAYANRILDSHSANLAIIGPYTNVKKKKFLKYISY